MDGSWKEVGGVWRGFVWRLCVGFVSTASLRTYSCLARQGLNRTSDRSEIRLVNASVSGAVTMLRGVVLYELDTLGRLSKNNRSSLRRHEHGRYPKSDSAFIHDLAVAVSQVLWLLHSQKERSWINKPLQAKAFGQSSSSF